MESNEASAAVQRAAILQRDGHLESAARLLHDVLAASTDAIQTFTLLNNLAGVRQRQGNLVEALELYEQALSLKEGTYLAAELVLGAQHNYGVCLRQAGRAADALPVSREALEGRRKLFGTGHVTSLASLRSYLRALSALGRHAEASDECARAIPAHLLGANHASCVAIRQFVNSSIRCQLEPSANISPGPLVVAAPSQRPMDVAGGAVVAAPSQRPMDVAGGAPPPLAPLCEGASSPQAPAPAHCCVDEPHWECSACRSLAARGWVILRLADDLAAVPSELIELAPSLFSAGVVVGGGAGGAQDSARMGGGCVCIPEAVPAAVGRHIELCHRLCCAVMGYLTASPSHVLPASLDPCRSDGDGATAACRDVFARSELQIFQYRSTGCVRLDSRLAGGSASDGDGGDGGDGGGGGDDGGGGSGGDEGDEGDKGGDDCGASAHHGGVDGESGSGVSHGRACACFACRSGGVLVEAHADQGFLTVSPPSSLPLLEALPPHAAPETAADAQEGREISRDTDEISRDTDEIGRDTDELRLIRAMLGLMTTDRADGWMPLEATLHPHELLMYAGKALKHSSAHDGARLLTCTQVWLSSMQVLITAPCLPTRTQVRLSSMQVPAPYRRSCIACARRLSGASASRHPTSYARLPTWRCRQCPEADRSGSVRVTFCAVP